MAQVKAIDVSKWNGNVDWDRVYADGVRAAVIRISCAGVEDEKFIQNYIGARRAGLLIGIYFVPSVADINELNAEEQAEKQVERCLYLLSGMRLDLPVFVDWEYAQDKNRDFSIDTRTEFIRCFCEKMKRKGYKCGTYTNLDYILYKLKWNSLNKYPLFFAMYNDGKPWAVKDNSQRKKYKALIWQAGTETVDGITGQVDAGWYYI